jgi:hypothetical protein
MLFVQLASILRVALYMQFRSTFELRTADAMQSDDGLALDAGSVDGRLPDHQMPAHEADPYRRPLLTLT